MDLQNVKKLNIPTVPGCYQFYNGKGEIIYIGKAANLKGRVFSYWQPSASQTPAKRKMLVEVKRVRWVITDSEIEALLLEANLIKKHQPYYNVLWRDDKRFVYIKVSLADEIPGVFLTRKIDKAGRYFGPFTSAQAARETLRVIRKIFPYCTMRKLQKRLCFYYQIGRCLGICAGKITRQEYMKRVIRPLMLFLAGKKGEIIKKLEVRSKKLEKYNANLRIYANAANKSMNNANEEELLRLKYELKNIKQALGNARVLSVGEKYANDVVELAKLLGLPKALERIEGYDIANIFGREAAGAMAVFSAGEADKNEYRKFKIRAGQGQANDARMLKEVLERRLNNSWPLPDLVIVDGGKAQLNAALRALKQHKLEIPLIAISKGLGLRSSIAPDKLFFPGEKRPLELPLASPALHLIKRVRDEAHRFAIGYHRKLRSRAKWE
jgi:excinuclease ABC subunit C